VPPQAPDRSSSLQPHRRTAFDPKRKALGEQASSKIKQKPAPSPKSVQSPHAEGKLPQVPEKPPPGHLGHRNPDNGLPGNGLQRQNHRMATAEAEIRPEQPPVPSTIETQRPRLASIKKPLPDLPTTNPDPQNKRAQGVLGARNDHSGSGISQQNVQTSPAQQNVARKQSKPFSNTSRTNQPPSTQQAISQAAQEPLNSRFSVSTVSNEPVSSVRSQHTQVPNGPRSGEGQSSYNVNTEAQPHHSGPTQSQNPSFSRRASETPSQQSSQTHRNSAQSRDHAQHHRRSHSRSDFNPSLETIVDRNTDSTTSNPPQGPANSAQHPHSSTPRRFSANPRDGHPDYKPKPRTPWRQIWAYWIIPGIIGLLLFVISLVVIRRTIQQNKNWSHKGVIGIWATFLILVVVLGACMVALRYYRKKHSDLSNKNILPNNEKEKKGGCWTSFRRWQFDHEKNILQWLQRRAGKRASKDSWPGMYGANSAHNSRIGNEIRASMSGGNGHQSRPLGSFTRNYEAPMSYGMPSRPEMAAGRSSQRYVRVTFSNIEYGEVTNPDASFRQYHGFAPGNHASKTSIEDLSPHDRPPSSIHLLPSPQGPPSQPVTPSTRVSNQEFEEEFPMRPQRTSSPPILRCTNPDPVPSNRASSEPIPYPHNGFPWLPHPTQQPETPLPSYHTSSRSISPTTVLVRDGDFLVDLDAKERELQPERMRERFNNFVPGQGSEYDFLMHEVANPPFARVFSPEWLSGRKAYVAAELEAIEDAQTPRLPTPDLHASADLNLSLPKPCTTFDELFPEPEPEIPRKSSLRSSTFSKLSDLMAWRRGEKKGDEEAGSVTMSEHEEGTSIMARKADRRDRKKFWGAPEDILEEDERRGRRGNLGSVRVIDI